MKLYEMTPTCTRLKERLDERRRWFINEWFFKWHFIGKDGPVTIDSFDGRGIHFGGIKFDGSARDVYWDAIVRGVKKEVTEQFAWVDREVRNYNPTTALRAIDECAGQITSFVRSIRREAVAKDRILRGDGINFPSENDAGHWHETDPAEITKQADALKSALPLTVVAKASQHLESPRWDWWERNKIWLEPTGWIIGVIGTISGLVVYLL